MLRYANYLKSKGKPTAILYKPKNFIEMEGNFNKRYSFEINLFTLETIRYSTDSYKT